MKKPGLNEDFICRIWEDGSNYKELKTCSGEDVEIFDYGKRNSDAGPDYKYARVRIGRINYSGSIEIHRSVNDWHLHKHKGDNKYNDVVLHVAFYDNDGDPGSGQTKVKRSRSVPTVILSEFLSRSVHEIWKDIINNPSPSFRLPCFPENSSVDQKIKNEWIEVLSGERLHFKSERIRSYLEAASPEINKKLFWEQALFEFICEALGFSKNKEQFRKLSGKIQIQDLKYKSMDLTETDSLLFGLSGFLYDLNNKDKYILDLKSSWSRLRADIDQESMDRSEWNFFRLRPRNFPTLRIAYASGLLYDILNKKLFKDIIYIFENVANVKKELFRRFSEIRISGYWNVHYNFGKKTTAYINLIGKERITDIIVNVILPFIYLYSVCFGKIGLKSRVENIYKKEKKKSGANEVIRAMEKQIGVKVGSIAGEQGLLQLHNHYCFKEKCKECEIGKIVFSNESVNEPLRIILY